MNALRRRFSFALIVPLLLGLASCGTGAEAAGKAGEVRLGMFANITHGTALVGVRDGIFQQHLGPGVKLTTSVFKSGGEVISALFSGAIDASYIGSTPAINGFAKSDGRALRIVAGATSGGAFLVVRDGISTPADLRGKKLATPALGNTQDVALRAWLKDQHLSADESGGGDVSILPQDNATTLIAFKAGAIDGAWVPEPWATRLVQEGGAKVLVDERDLWPGGGFITTQLIVATPFLDAHPDLVKRLLEGHVAATAYINANPAAAQRSANDEIEAITGKRIKDKVLAAAWKPLTFTVDPLAASLQRAAEATARVGFIDPVDLSGIYQLDSLNEVLAAAGEATVKGL
jgi:NitT/TauT family transport system substrate-binding protein